MFEPSLEMKTKLEIASLTDRGTVRERNEDSLSVREGYDASRQNPLTLLVVADGMGGYEGGDLASKMVTDQLPEMFYSKNDSKIENRLDECIREMSCRIKEASGRLEGKSEMGTTVVACAIVDARLISVNVGDSRAYLFRGGRLRMISKDHSLSGGGFEGLRFGHFSHVLTQALGPTKELTPHTSITELLDGDIILLCTDGLSGSVSEKEIESVLGTIPVSKSAESLVQKAMQNGSDDNISAIVARYTSA